ncbi:hypothetical protein PMAYCL1PPCAC_04779, partial [Pristionchus mayeri]
SQIMQFLSTVFLLALLAITIEAVPIGLGYSANPYQLTAVDQFTSGSILDATGNNNLWLSRRFFY